MLSRGSAAEVTTYHTAILYEYIELLVASIYPAGYICGGDGLTVCAVAVSFVTWLKLIYLPWHG